MDAPEDINTLDGRVATFERHHHFNKRRASAASKKKAPSTITWPHQSPSPQDLAAAGFYYNPSPKSQDSVTCFLCGKALDGWEPEDDPISEHLAHVPDCGWAINVAIERRSQDHDRAEQDPLNDGMMEARRSTYKDLWPHEAKKGWKGKVEKMVAAGWCYAPLPEANDCVQCPYCGVSLDGWEPKDDPWEEHQKRAPECHFFTLIDESTRAEKQKRKTGRGRQSKASKPSRTSTQSILEPELDEAPLELDDSLAEEDDTVLTTSSATSKAGKGRKTAAKRSIAPNPRRTARTKQPPTVDESVVSDAEAGDTVPTRAKPTKARKEDIASQELDMSEIVPKKTRAARSRKPSALDDTVITVIGPETSVHVDTSATSPPVQPQLPKKSRAKKQKQNVTVSNSESVSNEPDAALPEPPTRKVSRAKPPKIQAAPEIAPAKQDEVAAVASEDPPTTRGKKRTSDGSEKLDSSLLVNAKPVKNPKAKSVVPKRARAPSRALKRQPGKNAENFSDAPAEAVELEESDDLHADAKEGGSLDGVDEVDQAAGEQPNEESESAQPPPTPPLEPSNLSSTVSPQSSDAENHPPSARQSFHAAPKGQTVTLARPPPTSATPISSPSKRVIAGGLTSTVPWDPVDLEHIFLPSPSSHRIIDVTLGNVMQRLTSPEKKMSVEEWILWNAGKAEQRLKEECERLIGVFEGEGVKALRALEGVECA